MRPGFVTGVTAIGGVLALGIAFMTATGDEAGSKPGIASHMEASCEPVDAGGSQRQKAFATADGFGRFARGGRGGVVFPVTTLADTGSGSLRECAEASGPRTCVFRVSGTIAVDDWIRVTNPYLTIAGQTSPGGIAIRIGKSFNAPMLVQTHDVIIRHIRLRPGPSLQPSDNVDTIQISGGAHDVILDHVSTSWPTDEGINIVGHGLKPAPCGETRAITVQWSILSEGLDRSNRGSHSRGTYFGYGARQITFHHNLIASNLRRNPLLNTRGQFDMVNNVIYNSGRYNGEFYTRFGDLSVNVIGNVARLGPASDKSTRMYLVDYFRDYPAKFSIYLKDNIDIHRPANRGDESLVLEPNDHRYVKDAPVGRLSVAAGTVTGPGVAYRAIIESAGATRPQRDDVDRRVIGDMVACRGMIIDDPQQVGGWPTLVGPAPPIDQDNDGMADAWEVSHGLSPSDARDRNVIGADGYTNLERYLGELADDHRARTPPPGPDPDPSCGYKVATSPPLPNVQMTVEPATVRRGASAVLSWKGTNIGSCKLTGKGVPASGTRDVFPVETTTYEIACTGPSGGDTIDSVVVKVGS